MAIPGRTTLLGDHSFGFIKGSWPNYYQKVENFTICGEADSTAQAYATQHGFAFITHPIITTQPESASVVLGKAATFAVSADGENLSYQWEYKKVGQSDWSKWTGKTDASLTLKASNTNDGCQYRCVVTNEAGSSVSSIATLTVVSANNSVLPDIA